MSTGIGKSSLCYSLILPTFNASSELDLCLRSLAQNSCVRHETIILVDPDRSGIVNQDLLRVLRKHGEPFAINESNLGPYGGWNMGVKLASTDTIVLITDDQYFAPGWDGRIIKHMNRNRILTCQLVEPGLLPVWDTNFCRNFGQRAEEFREQEFLRFVKKKERPGLSRGGSFIPMVMLKDAFLQIGGFPVRTDFLEGCPYDRFFVQRALMMGFEYYRVLDAFSYHFQASSWKYRTADRNLLVRKLRDTKRRLARNRGSHIFALESRPFIAHNLSLVSGCGKLIRVEDSCCLDIVAIDIDKRVFKEAHTSWPYAQFVRCDASYLPFTDMTSYDSACKNLLEHVKDWHRVVREIIRVTRHRATFVYPTKESEEMTSRLVRMYGTKFVGRVHVSQPDVNAIVSKLEQAGFSCEVRLIPDNKLYDFLYLPFRLYVAGKIGIRFTMDGQGSIQTSDSRMEIVSRCLDLALRVESFAYRHSSSFRNLVRLLPIPFSSWWICGRKNR